MIPPKLSIVIPTYNHEKFIGQALQSCVMQKTQYPFEVIVSDDCSTDNTAAIIREYAAKYPELIKPIFREKNLGVGKTGNPIITLSAVNTEYVLYCEGDDYFDDPLKIEKQITFLEENPDFTICFHPVNVVFDDENLQRQVLGIFPLFNGITEKTPTFSFSQLLERNFMQTNSVMYRWIFRGDKKLSDLYPENIMPGDYFWHLSHAKEGKIGMINEIMATYRRHPDGIWIDSMIDTEALYLKYGEKQLNFFVQVAEKLLDNDSAYRKSHVYPTAVKLLLVFLRHKRIDKIQQLIDLCPHEYEAAVNILFNIAYAPVQNK